MFFTPPDAELPVAGAESFDGEVGGRLGGNADRFQPRTVGAHLARNGFGAQRRSLFHLRDGEREIILKMV